MNVSTLQHVARLAALWAAALAAHAQSTPAEDSVETAVQPVVTVPAARPLPEERSWRFGVALGYGQRSNPLIQSDDIPVVVDIDIAWFGKRWFFDNGDVGFALADNPLFTANVVARVNSDRTFFSKTNTRYVSFARTTGGYAVPITDPNTGAPLTAAAPAPLEVPDRDYAVELGLEVLLDGEWGEATLRGFHDVSQTHEGFELSADYGYRFARGRWSLSPSVGVAYKDAKLSDYYWGVHPGEGGLTLRQYHAAGGFSWEAGLRANYYLSKSLRAAVSANYERLQHSVGLSPMVEQPYVFGYFAGIAWQF
jgi:outer membrane protein